jgi:DNA primase
MRWSEYTTRILLEIDNESFYLGELKNVQRRGTEIKASCPFVELHEDRDDKNPSLTVNLDKGVYYCNTCKSKGNVHTFYKSVYNLTNEEAWFKLGDELKVPRPDGSKLPKPAIELGLVTQYHKTAMF